MSKLNPAQNQQLLNGIAKLLEYKNYNLALQGLENFFQNNTEPDTKEYLYARVLLLDAYLYNGRFDQAINLCQELSNSEHQTTQILAHYYLGEIFPEDKPTEQKSSLNSTKSSLTPAQATELINTGYEAITKKRYLEAIQALISFCKAASPDTKEYLKAHKLLIKAYQGNGQINHAIALCQQLLINEDEATRKWARQLLFTDLFTDNIIDVSATPLNPTESQVNLQTPSQSLPEEGEPAIEKFTPKTLKEFKTNRSIYISFVEDMIYIAIEEAVENNIFDPNLYKSVLSFAPLREYFETLNLMLGIVEDLNLDRHIWHKPASN